MATDVRRIDSGMALQGREDDIYLQEGDEQAPLADDASPAEERESDQ